MKDLKKMKVGQTKVEVWGMANLRPEDTGLPMVIWVSEKGNTRHGPRIKVSTKMGDKIDPKSVLTVTVSDDPAQIGGSLPTKVFDLVKKFIATNKDVLLGYWERQLSTKEMLSKLTKVKPK